MKRKIKFFGIGAAILLLLLSAAPAIYAYDPDPDLWDDCKTVLDSYGQEIEDLNNYIEEYIGEYGKINYTFDFPSDLKTKLNNIYDDLNEVLLEEDLEMSYYEPALQYETLEAMLENETLLPAQNPGGPGGGIDDIDADYFVELFPIPGFGFWLDWWASHETVEELVDEAAHGWIQLALWFYVICLMGGLVGAIIGPLIWMFAQFVMGDLVQDMEEIDEGNGIHFWWKHYFFRVLGLHDEYYLVAQ